LYNGNDLQGQARSLVSNAAIRTRLRISHSQWVCVVRVFAIL